ncbi:MULTISPECIES: nucleoside-diphosphate kinase [unclassified Brevibacterium]|uniref:nucleoside-diphosphate kinase n=1 Tax=unclassified Brevibacterium TaxID=2614124 RepID=UPI0008A317CD|nr:MULTISPECIES: nucleoside-diphosphate kinase [unclassified Brevibacterium]OFL64333.1 nucleoside-diphosphate kinase [Brevibacterium sp. HMSC063G07]OFS27043.1 nucleoside-diphosphate kinase [Brevibacterium sp. HMSC07C04]
MKERTLVLVKPDGVERGLVGEVIARLEKKGYEISAMKMVRADHSMLSRHYEEHEGKPFYEPLLEYMGSGSAVAIVVTGEEVIEAFRVMAGTTNPTTAAPGSIRGDFGRSWGEGVVKNIVHGSDSTLSAEREIKIWFPELG